MNERNTKMELLGSAPVSKALLALGLPTMVGMLINALYNLADSYFIGGLGTAQMGAITVAFPLGQVVVGLGLLFGNGAAAYLSRLLGRGDRETADKVASTALYSSVIIGAFVIFCSIIFLKPVLKMLGAPDAVMPYAVTYTSIYITFSIFNVFNVTMNNIVSSEGAAKTAMCALLAGALLNVILDPVFQLLTSLSMSMMNGAAKDYGTSALAAMGPAARIMSQFTRDDLEMIRTGRKFLKANGLSFVLFGFYTVYSFLFLVMGKAKEGCILGACRQGICFVPVILVLPAVMGLDGILYAQPVADVLSAIVTILMASRLHRELNAAEKRSSVPSPQG